PSFDEVNQITHNTSWYNQSIYENLTKSSISVDKNRISVSSSVDPYVQNILEDIVSCVSFDEATNIGVVVMQPETGNVLGIIGGKSVDGFNRVLSSSKAIGSTVKPILYTIALEEGFTPSSSFVSEPESFYLGDDIVFAPQNNNELYAYRKVNMVEALALSDNIYASKLALILGTDQLTN
ncbi:MAG TPA: penicillin-binding protein, partial [Firmicutes bacterium]|nr:penicillin-binding protein [Bacillota bacterium]